MSGIVLEVDEEHGAATLIGDTSKNMHTKWVPGNDADMGIVFYEDDDTLARVRIPIANNRSEAWHDGSLKINDGCRKR